MSVIVVKEFTFDSAHQLVGHFGKCANIHGHTYKLHVALKGQPETEVGSSDEGFVIDFYHLKQVVNDLIVEPLDHAFIAQGNEPTLEATIATGVKVVRLGFRSTVENMAQYICWRLLHAGLPVHYIQMWETPTGSAKVYSKDLYRQGGPIYNKNGCCDID